MGKDDEQTPLNPGIRIDKGEPGGGEPASGSATQPMMSAHAGDSKHKFTHNTKNHNQPPPYQHTIPTQAHSRFLT